MHALASILAAGRAPGRRFASPLRLAALAPALVLLSSGAPPPAAIAPGSEVAPLELTPEERAWIDAHPTIRLGVDPEFHPFEYLDEKGRYSGLASDVVQLLNERLGLDMRVVPGLGWKEAVSGARAGTIDVLPCIGITAERSEFLAYSRPYLDFYRVIFTRDSMPYLSGLKALEGLRVGVQANSSHEGYLVDHSTIDPVRYATLGEALRALSAGEVDAFVGNVSASIYWVRRMNLSNVKVSGAVSDETQDLHFGVRRDWAPLVGILDKGLATITKKEMLASHERWVEIAFAPGIPMRRVLWLLLGCALLFSWALYWNRHLKAEIQERAELQTEVERAHAEAERANLAKSTFLASMSHELRTPLNSIIGFTGVLQKELPGPLNTEQRKQLQMVRTSSENLLRLINDVLDISRIEAGELKVAMAAFDFAELAAEVVGSLRPQAEDRGIGLRARIAPEVGEIVSDRRRIGQVLVNLVGNALKFTESGHVELRAALDGERLVVAVEDTGIGISPEHRRRVFEPFYQIEGGATRRFAGTGLGLSICVHILELVGGELTLESEPGQGSTFSFHLPLGGVDSAETAS